MGHVQKHSIDSTDHHGPSTLAELDPLITDASLARQPKFAYFSANHSMTDAFDVYIGITNEFTFTLPPAISFVSGTTSRFLTVKNAFNNTNDIAVAGDSAELIDGLPSRALGPGDAMRVVSDGTTWHRLDYLGIPSFKDYTFTSNGIGSGVYYVGGFYDAPVADTTLTQASLTQTYGTVNAGYNAHAFVVFGGAGTVDTGQVGLRVNGASYDENTGIRTAGDSEVLTDDITSVVLNEYLDTIKHFVGQVTYELYVVSGTPTTYSVDFNYGFGKWEDFNDRDHKVLDFEVTGLAGGSDTGFNMELLKQDSTSWTYHATAFVPGSVVLASWSTSFAPDDELVNGKDFSYKRRGLGEQISSALHEGTLVRITTGTNNAVQEMSVHLGVEF